MKQLTKRERALIYIMVCIALIFSVAYFLIIPAKNNYDELSEKKDNLIMSKQSIVYEIENLDERQNNYDNIVKKIEAEKANYYSVMPSDDIDLMFSTLVNQFSVKTQSMLILEREIIAEEVVSTETDSLTDSETEQIKPAENPLSTFDITIVANGTFENINSLINNIIQNKKLVLSSYDFQKLETEGATVSYNLTMSIELNLLKNF